MPALNTNAAVTNAINFRIAVREDAENITNIINSAFRKAEEFFIEEDRIDLKSVLNFLNTGTFILAESEGAVMGCVYVEPGAAHDGHSYLGLLSVDPARQRSGLGSLLMEAAEEHCRRQGHSFMDIKIVNLREDLPAYYRKRGYVETGTSPFPADVETKMPCHFIDMSKSLRQP